MTREASEPVTERIVNSVTQSQPTPEQAAQELRAAVAVCSAVYQYLDGQQIAEADLLPTLDALAVDVGGVEKLILPLSYVALRLASLYAGAAGGTVADALRWVGQETAGEPWSDHA